MIVNISKQPDKSAEEKKDENQGGEKEQPKQPVFGSGLNLQQKAQESDATKHPLKQSFGVQNKQNHSMASSNINSSFGAKSISPQQPAPSTKNQ